MPRHEIHLKSAILPAKSHRILPWYPPEDKYSGGELIAVYQSYCNEPDDEALTLLKLHNYEDVAGMVEILPILSYAHLKDMQIRITDLSLSSYTDYQGIQNRNSLLPLPLLFVCPHPCVCTRMIITSS